MPVILAAWECEDGGIMVRDQSGKKFERSHLYQSLNAAVHVFHPSYGEKYEIGVSCSRLA
jgi:hypothetical protein